MTEQCEPQFEICSKRFDHIETKIDRILVLLRGEGDKTGLVGRIGHNTEQVTLLRKVTFGDKTASGLAYQVQQLLANGASRQTAEQERKAFMRSVISKLLTAGLIALVAFLLSLYRSSGGH